jgi:hypothetical protein
MEAPYADCGAVGDDVDQARQAGQFHAHLKKLAKTKKESP